MTADEARAILLDQPNASEGSHHGHPDFRIGKSLFATLWPSENRSVLRLPLPFSESLENEMPDLYKVVSRPKDVAWLSVQLENMDPAEFRSLAEMARALLGRR